MGNAVEFSLITDLRAFQNVQINATFEETMNGLVEMMEPYAGVVVTESDIPTAKSDLAKIRKVKTRIDDVRKDVKRQYMEPFNRFEERCKELVAVCEKAEENIDTQIKGFSHAAKAEKRERLEAWFLENIGDMTDFLTFDVIYNKRWENVTYAEEKAKEDIVKMIGICRKSVNAIRGLNSEFEAALLDYYKQTHSLEGAMAKAGELKAMKEAEEKRRPQNKPVPTNDPNQKHTNTTKTERDSAGKGNQEKLYTLDFRVTAPKAKIEALRIWMIENGILFGRVSG